MCVPLALPRGTLAPASTDPFSPPPAATPTPAQSPGPGRRLELAPNSTHSRGLLLFDCGASCSGPCPHVLQGKPPKSRPRREPDTHSQIWVENKFGAAMRIYPASQQKSGVETGSGFLQAEDG